MGITLQAAARSLLCCVALAAVLPRDSRASTIDTTIFGDGTPGPYCMGPWLIDSGSIRVTALDSTRILPQYSVNTVSNTVLFGQPLDSGFAFKVHYRTLVQGLPKTYYLFRKEFLKAADSTARVDTTIHLRAPVFSREDLAVTGYKSIDLSVGNLGQTNLAQAMDITISGEVADRTELKAHLSDQGSSLDGATREISQLDLVYIALANPRYAVTVGDQYIRWPAGGMLTGEKKVKGLTGSLTPRHFAVTALGSLSQGSFASESFRGQTGLQGPYYLHGNGGGQAQPVTPVGGTVTVWMNGDKLEEGPDKGYTVDYDFGSVTFTPRRLVKESDVFRVEYEYKLYDYQRVVAGADIAAATPDSTLSVRGALWYEADNPDHPVDLQINARDRDSLGAAGDGVYVKPMFSYTVDPRKADSVGVYTGVYVKERDSAGQEYFALTDDYRSGKALYQVPFRRVASGTGEYREEWHNPCAAADSAGLDRGHPCGPTYRVYIHVGHGGDFTAGAPLPSPRRSIVGEAVASFKPAPWLSVALDIAGLERDNNLLSRRDDDDNLGAASHATLSLGARRTDRPSLWFTADHRFISRRFDLDVLSAYRRQQDWNDTSVAGSQCSRNSWEAAAGAALPSGFRTELSYAQLWHGDSLVTDRFGTVLSASPAEPLALTFNGTLFRRPSQPSGGLSRRDELRGTLDLKRLASALAVRDEWRWDSAGGRGLVGAQLALTFRPVNLSEKLDFSSFRKGNRDLFSSDTGYSLVWEQSLSHTIGASWKLSGSCTYRHVQTDNPRVSHSSVLALVESEITPRTGIFSSRQKYSLSSERGSQVIQEPTYVGPGLGNYSYDSTATGNDRYRPKQGGDWIIREREYTDPLSDSRVRKASLELSWSLFPRGKKLTGLIADLDWRGFGAIQEQIPEDSAGRLSWIPGYLTLSHDPDSRLVSFADVYYRQTVDWRPSFDDKLHAGLLGRPFRKIVRGYSESGVEWGGGIDRRWAKLLLGLDTRFLYFTHDNLNSAAGDFRFRDQYAELSQTYSFTDALSLYVKETAGYGRDSAEAWDDGYYFSIKPGLSWRPVRRGLAEASYTFSSVRKDRMLDPRMARGMPLGVAHVIEMLVDLRFGDHFSANASYRGEVSPSAGAQGQHVVSVGVKAYL